MKSNIVLVSAAVFFPSMMCLCVDEIVGRRPYEMEWAGRTKDSRAPLIDFENLTGWTVECSNTVASFERGRRQQIWGRHVGKLIYRAKGGSPAVIVKPSSPIALKMPFDCINLWVYGNNWHYIPDPETPQAGIFVLLKNSGGEIIEVSMGNVFWRGWWVMHSKLLKEQLDALKDGAVFYGIKVINCTNPKDRMLFFDNLAVYREQLQPLTFDPRPERGITMFEGQSAGLNTGPGRLPFPTRELTLLPTNKAADFKNTLAESDGGHEFTYSGPDGTLKYVYRPETGTLDDITVQWLNKKPFKPMSGGGLYFAREAAQPSLVECKKVSNKIISTWKYKFGGKTAEATYTFQLRQKSLVVDVKCAGGLVHGFRIGKAVGVENPRLVRVPYLVGDEDLNRPNVMVTGPQDDSIFTTAIMDHTRSNASELFFVNAVTHEGVFYNGGTKYFPKTDGKRNDCFERLFLTVSADFDEILPNIPNPKSPWKHVTGTKMWCVSGAENREEQYKFWKQVARYGMTDLIITDHETGWRDDGESFTLRTRTAPGKGGDESQALYAKRLHDLGFNYGIYNNYTDFAPVNGHWSEDAVTRRSDGGWMTAWPRCYNLKPARAVEFEAKLTPIIKRKFTLSTAYCDVHSALRPWFYLDYDARVPGAGSFTSTFYAYGEIFLHQKKVWGGPVYSEGGHHWYYCGLVDGNYAQDRHMLLSKNPWLVNFDLLKIHPLSCNFGIGGIGMFFGPSYGINGMPNGTIEELDHFMAATLAFGHTGFLVFGIGMPGAVQSYYPIQQVFSRYSQQDAADIRYCSSTGRLIDTSSAVATGEYERSQIVTTYQDGFKVTVNGHQSETWIIDGNVLPPNGWYVEDPSDTLTAFSKSVDGRRIDYVDSPAYLYANGRGEFTRFGKCACNGQLLARKLDDGRLEVIPVNSTIAFAVALAGKPGRAVALDAGRNEIGPAETRLSRGLVSITPEEGAFSYILTAADDNKVAALQCARDRVVAGEKVSVIGADKKRHSVTIPADAKTGRIYYKKLDGAWIDFLLVDPIAADLVFRDGKLILSLSSRMARTVSSRVEFDGRRRMVNLPPDRTVTLKYDPGKPADGQSKDLILKVAAGDTVFNKKWSMQVDSGFAPVVKLPAKFHAGQCIRGRREEPMDVQTGAQVLLDIGICGGITKEALMMHPPWKNGETGYVYALFEGIRLPAEPKAVMRCSVGKHDGSYPGDGILFKLAVIDDAGKETVVAEKHWSLHSWTDFEADLSAWAGGEIKLKFISDPGGDDNSAGDWPRWGDVRIESRAPQLKVTLSEKPL